MAPKEPWPPKKERPRSRRSEAKSAPNSAPWGFYECLVFAKYLNILARLAGFEPATHGLEVRCSVQLSYRRSADIVSHIRSGSTMGALLCLTSRSRIFLLLQKSIQIPAAFLRIHTVHRLISIEHSGGTGVKQTPPPGENMPVPVSTVKSNCG